MATAADLAPMLPSGWRGRCTKFDGKSRIEIETPFGYYRRFYHEDISEETLRDTVAAAVAALA